MKQTEIYAAKWYTIIGVVVIAYVIGFIMGFSICATTPKAHAAQTPIMTNVQNTQSNINTQTVYVDGQRFIVFTSGYSSMAVVKR